MHLTVEDALSVYPLSEGKLVAGAAGKNRIVKSVNVMDAPDIWDWIKDGEMLFTTGYLIKDDPQGGAGLLEQLNRRGSSGLGIKLGRFWEQIPPTLILMADKLGFPLIQLPYEFTFSDQMNGLYRAEMQRSTKALQAAMEKQKRLMRFALQSDPILQLFEEISGVVGYPLAVVSAEGRALFNNSGVPEESLLRAWPWTGRHPWVKGEGWQCYRVPLLSGAKPAGYACFVTGEPLFTTLEEGLFHQAAELIAYQMEARIQSADNRSRQYEDQIRACLAGALPPAELAAYGESSGNSVLKGAYIPVLTSPGGTSDTAGRSARMERIRQEYGSHPVLSALGALHLDMEEGVLSLFPDGAGADELAEHLASCSGNLRKSAGCVARAAIGGRRSGEQSLASAWMELKETLRLAAEWGVPDPVVPYRKLELAYLFEHCPKERMAAFCDRVLGGLLRKEPEYRQEMLRTLEVYLDNDGQLSETAKKLYIHRNTASYRMDKISELLEVDLKKTDDLLRLKLAFQLRGMSAKAEEPAAALRTAGRK